MDHVFRSNYSTWFSSYTCLVRKVSGRPLVLQHSQLDWAFNWVTQYKILCSWPTLYCTFMYPKLGGWLFKRVQPLWEDKLRSVICWLRQSLDLSAFQTVPNGACRADVPAGPFLRNKMNLWTEVDMRSPDESRVNWRIWRVHRMNYI